MCKVSKELCQGFKWIRNFCFVRADVPMVPFAFFVIVADERVNAPFHLEALESSHDRLT